MGLNFGRLSGIFPNTVVKFIYLCRMTISWEDKRYISDNGHREEECPGGDVVWDYKNEYWVPNFYVWDVIELVIQIKLHMSDFNNVVVTFSM